MERDMWNANYINLTKFTSVFRIITHIISIYLYYALLRLLYEMNAYIFLNPPSPENDV